MAGLSRNELIALALVGVLTIAAGAAHFLDWPAIPAFLLATLALAGLAWIVSFATEQVGERFGPSVTGVLQSTLGNLPELFVVIFALNTGQVVVAQTSIIGSIFANALLVLGLALVAGCLRSEDGVMRFQPRIANDTATLLLLAVFIIVLLGIGSHEPGGHISEHVDAISIVGAVCLLGVYGRWLWNYLRSGRGEQGGGEARLPMAFALVLLAVSGAGAAFVSDWFVTALEPTIDQLNLTAAFAGIVIVAIAGNAVENVAGIVLAWKGQADLAISVVKNSVAQIAAFLFPALVLISFAFSSHLTFELEPLFIGALALTALAVWQVSGDGEASEFEGWALVATYIVLATLTFFD
jgi:Ca2+:H+ antiporter